MLLSGQHHSPPFRHQPKLYHPQSPPNQANTNSSLSTTLLSSQLNGGNVASGVPAPKPGVGFVEQRLLAGSCGAGGIPSKHSLSVRCGDVFSADRPIREFYFVDYFQCCCPEGTGECRGCPYACQHQGTFAVSIGPKDVGGVSAIIFVFSRGNPCRRVYPLLVNSQHRREK